MAMVVRSNLMAYNANRQLGMNNSAVSKNLEKLSSGFKINRAADDAAGLAVSEKMKAQIKGLEQASLNSQDGISLVQTAEGALTEVHDMLNRMTELATKSANGTIQDDVDREAIQNEVNKLNEEIDRIADSTNFNGIKLLDGSLSGGGGTSAVSNMKFDGAITTTDVDATAAKSAAALKGTSKLAKTTKDGDKVSFTVAYNVNGQSKNVTVDLTLATNDAGDKILKGTSGKEYAVADFAADGVTESDLDNAVKTELEKSALGKDFKITGDYNTTGFQFEGKTKGSGSATVTALSSAATVSGTTTRAAIAVGAVVTKGEDAYKTATGVAFDGTNADAAVFTVNGKKFAYAVDGTDVSSLDKNVTVVFGDAAVDASTNLAAVISKQTGLNVTSTGANAFTFKAGTGTAGSDGGLTLQIGDTGEDFNQVTVSVDNMKSTGIGTAGLDVSNQSAAKESVQTIKDAINKVSTNRSELGALQNRLEHTINNLDVTAENMTNANSRIRDTDMAKQMMEYTKMNVLTQSAQAMLAQANQNPQSILQLLQ